MIDQSHSFLFAVSLADLLVDVGDGHGERGPHGGVHPGSRNLEWSHVSGSQHLTSPAWRWTPAFLDHLVPSGLTKTSVYVTLVYVGFLIFPSWAGAVFDDLGCEQTQHEPQFRGRNLLLRSWYLKAEMRPLIRGLIFYPLKEIGFLTGETAQHLTIRRFFLIRD